MYVCGRATRAEEGSLPSPFLKIEKIALILKLSWLSAQIPRNFPYPEEFLVAHLVCKQTFRKLYR